MNHGSLAKALLISLLASGGVLGSSPARAEVRHVGDWDDDPEVTIDLDHTPRDVAVKRLAAAAGWSLVSAVPPGEPIDIHVRNQRAGKVLDLLLTDSDYIAKRDGSLIALRRAAPGEALPPSSKIVVPVPSVVVKFPVAPPAPPAPPAMPAMPEPPEPPEPPEAAEPPEPPEPAEESRHVHHDHGSDREVFGDSLRVEKGEVVNDVTVFGGNADVWGTVKGDLVVTGGNVRVYEGARVMGDVTSMGGTVTIDDHARVDGDISTVGGLLRRGKSAEIHGDVSVDDREHSKSGAAASQDMKLRSFLDRASREVGDAVTGAALLFVFGAVLLSLMTARMENLKVEIASRPMRSFATGVVALIGWIVLTVALCITVVGIPLALVSVLGGIVAVFAGLSAALETLGAALLRHKTRNPYVHLAFGCGLFLVLGAIPFVGSFFKLAVFLTGIGCVAATRGAGFFPAKNKSAGSPYRDVSTAM